MADIPTAFADWDADPAGNQPEGSTIVGGGIDDNFRQSQATLRSEFGSRGTIVAAGTTDIGAEPEGELEVTGNTAITSFGTVSAGIRRRLKFAGTPTLTYNATSLKLPGAANITVEAGDTAEFVSLGSGNWDWMSYQRASGRQVLGVSSFAGGIEATPGFTPVGDPDTGLYSSTANTLGISASGTRNIVFGAASTDVYKAVALQSAQLSVSYSGAGNIASTSGGVQVGSAHYRADESAAGAAGKYFHRCTSGGGADVEFLVTTDGTVSSDGGASMSTPADYAEMFEWSDGNPAGEDRVGMAVALAGERIRLATAGDVPIGVVSGNPAVLADAGSRWSGKYLRDDFNRAVLDQNGHRTLNPAFDPEAVYVPRIERREWAPVGLVGKLRLRKGQPVAPGWVLMREVSGTVDEWLVK